MSNPYAITEQAINELRERSTEKLKKLFPQGVPQEILKRINREESALRTNPNIYSLLIVDDVIKTLRRHKFSATVDGDWFSSYHAWLLDLTEYNPIDIQLCYRDMGLCAKQFIRDDCVSSPIEIYRRNTENPCAWTLPGCMPINMTSGSASIPDKRIALCSLMNAIGLMIYTPTMHQLLR